MVEIKIIGTKEINLIRLEVLRKGKPIESCIYEGYDNPTTIHFDLFKNNKLKGVTSAFKQKNITFNKPIQYQIRGMAIIDSEQKKGYRKLLITYLEQFLNKERTNLIWFNTGEVAVDFYKKLNFSTTGIPFEIENIGTHLIMFKKLQ